MREKYPYIFQAGAQRCTGGRNIAAVQVAEKAPRSVPEKGATPRITPPLALMVATPPAGLPWLAKHGRPGTSRQDPGAVVGVPVGEVLDPRHRYKRGRSCNRCDWGARHRYCRTLFHLGIAAHLLHVATALVGKVDGRPEGLIVVVVSGGEPGVVNVGTLERLFLVRSRQPAAVLKGLCGAADAGIRHQGAVRLAQADSSAAGCSRVCCCCLSGYRRCGRCCW